MASEGCYITAIANILTASGHDTTPLQVLQALEYNGGIDPNGLVKHANVTQAFPQFVYGGSGYGLVCGLWKTTHGVFTHFIAQMHDGSYVDSYTGHPGLPAGYSIKSIQTIGITGNVPPVTPPTFTLKVNKAAANVRNGSTSISTIVGTLNQGNTFEANGQVIGESVSGNNVWYKDANNHYIWSGGLTK